MLHSVRALKPMRGQLQGTWNLRPVLPTSSMTRTVNNRSETLALLRYQSSLLSKSRTSSIHPSRSLAALSPSFHSQKFAGDSSSSNVHVLGSLSYFSNWSGGPPRPGGNRWMQGAGVIGAGAMLLGKTKYLVGVLKLTKLASLGSMIFTIGTYSMFFGLPYAAGMVGLITVHEAGHALVMHHRGIPFSPMVFMPFMGAMVQMNQRPRNAWEDALVAFGGPVAGSIGAAGVALAAHMTQSQLLFALSDFGFMVNLFNLIPLGSMDGGRIAGALSPWAHVAGLGIGGTLALTGAIHNPIFYLILLSGGYETYQRFYNPGSIPPGYYAITPMQRAAIGAGYFCLVGSLALAMDVNERFKKPPEVLIRERELEKHWDMR